jgi:predicted DNA-binding transcriptional regulator AlpA
MAELSTLLGVSPGTIRWWAANGAFPEAIVRGAGKTPHFWSRAAVETWIAERAAARAEVETLRDVVNRSLVHMDARRRQVLLLRWGINGERRLTLGEVGEELGVTRERIRQIEHRAFDDLGKDVLPYVLSQLNATTKGNP